MSIVATRLLIAGALVCGVFGAWIAQSSSLTGARLDHAVGGVAALALVLALIALRSRGRARVPLAVAVAVSALIVWVGLFDTSGDGMDLLVIIELYTVQIGAALLALALSLVEGPEK